MKKVFLAAGLIAALAFTGCKDNASEKVKGENVEMAANRDANATAFPKMEFEESEYDFGNIERGTGVEHVFKFKNTGDAPLVIVDATSTCGCTVPSFPEEPIAPGDTGELLVKYNGSGMNAVTKIVTVKSNTQKGTETVKITAFVKSEQGPTNNG
ncbi:DUF1573 domain-containing protein [Leeuwenhoekiella sp. W20_SRS_FM14]|uniref:DUF1573 domain-containing protein n=1 Tax=Leeuwenhoekiella sp. W20_SRS_FM14 TaxID=3240270 RepID=UPI003F9ADA84